MSILSLTENSKRRLPGFWRLQQYIIVITFCLTLSVNTYSQRDTVYYQQGLEKEEAGEFNEAIKLFDKAISLNPHLYEAWSERGHAKGAVGDNSGALGDFEQSIQINSNNKIAWSNRGLVKFHMADYKGCVADLDRAIALDSTDAKAWYVRGTANEKLGNTGAACADFRVALGLGMKELQGKINLCDGKAAVATNKKGIIVLDEENNTPHLLAIGPQLVSKGEESFMLIVFVVRLSSTSTSIPNVSNLMLKPDSLSSITIILEGGETISLSKSPINQPLTESEPLVFMGLFNPKQEKLLEENNIQKISFLSDSGQYEYVLKSKYADKIKQILTNHSQY